MAAYSDLRNLFDDSDLRNKIAVAVVIAAETIRTDVAPPANQTDRMAWAKRAFKNPQEVANEMLPALIAQNQDLAVSAIKGASDTAIQTAVDSAVDVFATPDPVAPVVP